MKLFLTKSDLTLLHLPVGMYNLVLLKFDFKTCFYGENLYFTGRGV